jgi:glucokinase
MAAGANSAMLELAGGDVAAFTGEIVGKAAAAGDDLAIKILTEGAEMLALWLSNIVDLFDPEVIVIGGGAAVLYQSFFGKLHDRISHLTVNPRADEVPILPARYGADAGIAGGAALCT